MLDTHSLLLPLHSSPSSITTPCPLSTSRTALADSTNVNSHTNVRPSGHPKSLVYPTSYARTTCGWNDFESGSASTLLQPRHHHSSSTLSPFLVTYKAPPTVSISLSAACSQSILGERLCSSRAQGLEPDLPDVKSVIPFPSTPLNSEMDVDMFDGTTYSPSAGLAPRKRHSAHSSVSSSPGNLGKEMKPKRQRKSKRQVAELCWLGVVHRSILLGIEARQSYGKLDAPDRLLSGLRDLDAMDRLLVERIQKRLADNGCVEGRAAPNPLPRISSPRISVPSLNLVAPSGKTLSTGPPPFAQSLDGNLKGSDIPADTVASPPIPKPHPSTPSLSSHSHSPNPPDTFTSHRRHVHFETPQPPHHPPPHPSIPRRSPSPPARTGVVSTNAQMLTLTIPHLVAALVLAHHERSGLRLRGRTYKLAENEKNAGRSTFSAPSDRLRCSGDDDKARTQTASMLRTRLTNPPERRSPLSRIVYTGS